MQNQGPLCPRASEPCTNPIVCRGILLRQVLAELVPDDIRDKCKERLEILFARSTTHQQAVQNLEAECNLPCRFWRTFAEKVSAVPATFDDVFAAVRDFMREATFSGPLAKTQPAKIFGRATTRDDLAAVLLEQGHAWDEGFAEELVDELDRSVDDIRKRWSLYDLGRWVMWSTFNKQGTRPFDGIKREAQFIRGVLGLPRRKDEEKTPLLLIEYTLENKTAHIPTVAEAYASDPWISYFRTAGDIGYAAGHGRTHARDHYDEMPGLPEVVHSPVTGAALTEKPELVR